MDGENKKKPEAQGASGGEGIKPGFKRPAPAARRTGAWSAAG